MNICIELATDTQLKWEYRESKITRVVEQCTSSGGPTEQENT